MSLFKRGWPWRRWYGGMAHGGLSHGIEDAAAGNPAEPPGPPEPSMPAKAETVAHLETVAGGNSVSVVLQGVTLDEVVALLQKRSVAPKGNGLPKGRLAAAFALGLVLAVALAPRPARAIFGIGDTVFDPIVNSGIIKQVVLTIEEIQHLYNIYQQGSRMLNNLGSGNIAGAMSNFAGLAGDFGYANNDLKTAARVAYYAQNGNYLQSLVAAGEMSNAQANVVQQAMNIANAGSTDGKLHSLFALGRALDTLDKTGKSTSVGRQRTPIGQSVALYGARPSFEAYNGETLPSSMAGDPLAARTFSRNMLGPTSAAMASEVTLAQLANRQKTEDLAAALDAHGVALYHMASSSMEADRLNALQQEVFKGGATDLQGEIGQLILVTLHVAEETASVRNLLAAQLRMEAARNIASTGTTYSRPVVAPLLYSDTMAIYKALDTSATSLNGAGATTTPGTDGTISWSAPASTPSTTGTTGTSPASTSAPTGGGSN
ncbi:hypothetical protein [Azospirillum sp. B4]|uniref:hypothetical protein n=1 Tax=Azospirillum sp. B4 TaxID=95605 RepID=UPI00034958E2|nr:hypothetical protein [Azospirillum sp. B4]